MTPKCKDSLPWYRKDVVPKFGSGVATVSHMRDADGFAAEDTRPRSTHWTEQGPISLGYGTTGFLTGQPTIDTLRSVWRGDTRTLRISDRYYQ